MSDRPRSLLFLLLLSFLPQSPNAEDMDPNLNVDRSGWVSLLDPLSGELQGIGTNRECRTDEMVQSYQKRIEQLIADNEMIQSRKSESVDVLLKHILRQFFIQLNVELADVRSVSKYARVYLSTDDVSVILEYLDSQKHSEEIALREKLRSSLENFIVTAEDDFGDSGLVHRLRKLIPYVLVLNVVFLPFVIMGVFKRITTPRQFIGFFLVATFCLSYYFTYIRKYQEVLADRFSRVEHSSDVCSPKGLISEAVNVLLGYIRIKGKDQCLQKYEDMLVEPFLLVDPLRVFGEVVTNFLMSPFSVIGIHLNKFFNDFFVDTPFILAIVKLLIILLVLFYLSHYRIKSIFFTIEPAPHQLPERSNQLPERPDPPYRELPANNPPLEDSDSRRNPIELFDVINLDDSNVTRRRKKIQRSRSMPRTFHTLSLQ